MARYRESPPKSTEPDVGATNGSSDRDAPVRMSEEYVSRLESELAALKANVKDMGDPSEPVKSAPSSTDAPNLKRAPSAKIAPPQGKATASSKTTLDEDLEKAQAKYSDDRLAKFEAALEEKFKQSGGYDSDLERELIAAENMPSAHEVAVGKVTASKNAKALQNKKNEIDAVNAPFKTQNEWMDEYRKEDDASNVPVSGASNLNARRPSTADPTQAEGRVAVKESTARPFTASLSSKTSTESPLEEIDAARAAVAATRASAPSLAVTCTRVPKNTKGAPNASFLGSGAHGDQLPRPSVLIRSVRKSATVPKPPSFLSRDAARAKTISEQRLEQDLAVEQALLEAELRKQFKAAPVPKSTKEPRFTAMLETEIARRERNREMRKQALVETEQPFSFYVRDQQSKTEKSESQKANRFNKFQRKFKAKEIPKAVKELRLPSMEHEAQRRKEEIKMNAEIALKESKMPDRMAANLAKAGGVATNTDDKNASKKKKWSFQPAPRKPVPDFDALHASFFRRLKEAKQSRSSTTVSEFKLHEKTTPQRKAELRKIENDRTLDENTLPEARWPFASLRAKVTSTPPPEFVNSVDPDFLKKNENLATKLRRQAVVKAKAKGHYATKEEREALLDQERERENRRRAAAWARTQTSSSFGKAGSMDQRDDVAAAARRKQQNQIAKETVERVLMENNVYTYVEGGV